MAAAFLDFGVVLGVAFAGFCFFAATGEASSGALRLGVAFFSTFSTFSALVAFLAAGAFSAAVTAVLM